MCQEKTQTHHTFHNTLRLLYILGVVCLLVKLFAFERSDDPELSLNPSLGGEDPDPFAATGARPILIVVLILGYTLLEAATVFFSCGGSRDLIFDAESQLAIASKAGERGAVGEYGACRRGTNSKEGRSEEGWERVFAIVDARSNSGEGEDMMDMDRDRDRKSFAMSPTVRSIQGPQ